jgi:hypothetical protein
VQDHNGRKKHGGSDQCDENYLLRAYSPPAFAGL